MLQDESQRPDLLAGAAAGVRLNRRTPTLSDAELQPLAPAGPARAARDVLAELRLRDGTSRCVAVMISTLDGRAAVQGRSVALGHPADRALLRELRAQVDAVIVGTRTLAAERYATLLDDDQRAYRRKQGLPEHPLLATWSRTLDLPLDVPVFSEPATPIAVYTSSEAEAPAGLDVRRVAGIADIPGDLAQRGMPAVSCEGGPTLLRELAAAGVIDELLLTLAPLLTAGDAPAILEGPALQEPARLELRSAHRAGDHLFLRYGRAGGGP